MNALEIPDPVTLKVSKLGFISVWEPYSTYEGKNSGFFGLSFPWQDVPDALSWVFFDSIERARMGCARFVPVRSKRRPMVFGQHEDGADILAFKKKCDSRNIDMHAALVGCPADVHLGFWRKRSKVGTSVGVFLNAVTLDPKKIEFPGPLGSLYGRVE